MAAAYITNVYALHLLQLRNHFLELHKMRCLYKDGIPSLHIRIQMSQKTVSVRFFNDSKLRVLSCFFCNIGGKDSGTDANVNSPTSA